MIEVKYRQTRSNKTDDSASKAVLAGIVSNIRTMLPFSGTQVLYFAQLLREERDARRAELTDIKAELEEESAANLVELRALNNDPLLLESDEGRDLVDHLNEAEE